MAQRKAAKNRSNARDKSRARSRLCAIRVFASFHYFVINITLLIPFYRISIRANSRAAAGSILLPLKRETSFKMFCDIYCTLRFGSLRFILRNADIQFSKALVAHDRCDLWESITILPSTVFLGLLLNAVYIHICVHMHARQVV